MEWGCEAVNLALDWSKIEMNSRLEVSWALLGALLRIHGGIWWQILVKLGWGLAKLGQIWQQVATKMSHDTFKMGHDSGKIAILDSTWELLRRCRENFWSILAPWLESEKHWKTCCFLWFFALLRCSEGVAEASWGLSSMMLARRCHFSLNCWPWRRENGEQETQDGEQERQDEPT